MSETSADFNSIEGVSFDEREKKPGVGRFEVLQKRGVIHGYSRHDGNMAFNKAKTDDEKKEVSTRLASFLKEAGMNSLENAITLDGGISCKIVDLTNPQESEAVREDETGKFINADAVFMTDEGIPLLLKPADCFGLIVSAQAADGKKVSGLIHAGRKQLGVKLVSDAIRHLKEKYGVSNDNIVVCATPGLGKKHHIIRKELDEGVAHGEFSDNIDRVLGKSQEYWKKHGEITEDGDWLIDTLSALEEQLAESGVKPENMSIDERDIFDLAENGEFFSQRYSNENHTPSGRNVVAVQN